MDVPVKGRGNCVTEWSNPGGTWVSRGLNQGEPGSVTVVWWLFYYQIGWTEPPTGGQVHRGTRFHDTPGCQILFDKFGKVLDASRSVCGCWETSLPGSWIQFLFFPGMREGVRVNCGQS